MADNTTVFNAADDYERFMGRWSRVIGEKFLNWLAPPANARWLDVGCGTGAFSELIAKRCAPASLAGIDPSPDLLRARAALGGALLAAASPPLPGPRRAHAHAPRKARWAR